MKRFTEPNKWRDAWYIALSPNAKVVLGYIYDTCDVAGFIDFVPRLWTEQTNIRTPGALNEALTELQPVLLSNKAEKKLWLSLFLRQEMKLPLNPDSEVHQVIIEKLTRNLPKFGNAAAIKDILDNHIQKKSTTKKKTTSTSFVPPLLDEFKAYFKENGFSEELAQTAWKGYNESGWKDTNDKPIKNWKQKCQHVWFTNKNERSKTHKQHSRPANNHKF